VIDRQAVPPSTSPWTVIITAAAAFLGVVVAQWWTGRREDRNWQRQLQMYATQWEDQRTRDAELREDQRRKDQDSWHREDRHRFTEHKRTLYGQLLGIIAECQDELSQASWDFETQQKNATFDPALSSRLSAAVGEIELVAPLKVADTAKVVRSTLLGARVWLRYNNITSADNTIKEVGSLIADARNRVAALRQLMRQDLVVNDDMRDSEGTTTD
jgi:hypothetical protein